MDVTYGCDGVDASRGHGAVAAFARDDDTKAAAGRSACAALGDQHQAGRERRARRHMDHFCGVHMRVLQYARVHHVLSPFAGFLAGLKHELDLAFQQCLVVLQELCGAKEHGGVHIVSAGMHLSRTLGRKGLAGNLLQRKGVHISPQQDHLPTRLAHKDRIPGGAHLLRLIPHFHQPVPYELLRAGGIEPQFRVPMQRFAPCPHVARDGVSLLQDRIRYVHSVISPRLIFNKSLSNVHKIGKYLRSIPL